MKIRDKIILILLIVLAFSWSIYLIRSILAPFVFSLVLSYFLHPFVDRLCKKTKISRFYATAIISGSFFTFFIGICILIFPIIYTQTISLVEALPQYFQTLSNEIYPKIAAKLNQFGIHVNNDLTSLISDENLSAPMLDFLRNLASKVAESSVALINILSLIFITPILIFYLLKDWEVLVAKARSYLPAKFANHASKIGKEIDVTLSGYIRGQINVCMILAAFYSIALSIAGLNFGFLIGLLTGIFSFIPYVGAVAGFVGAMLVAFFEYGFDFFKLLPIALIFLIGQIIESNFLTPKLIGNKVGLHPVWIIFGLFVFGALFGFMGVLFATPLTAICGVLIRNLALEYKKRFT